MRAPFKAVFEVCRLSELLKLASTSIKDQVDVEPLDEEDVGVPKVLPQQKNTAKEPERNDEDDIDGAGTGGVGGLFSMTVTDEEEIKALGHFNENPFAEEEQVVVVAQPEIIEEEETKDQQRSISGDRSSHSSNDHNLDEWQEIDVSYFEILGVRPPDLMTDPFKERWNEVKSQYKKISKFRDYNTYTLRPVIIKANDDCRQEVLAIQLMQRLLQIWKRAQIPLWMRPYEIFITSASSAMIEFVPDTISVHHLKKKMIDLKYFKLTNLHQFYRWYFHEKFEEAQYNFIRSLAAYSIFSYLFAIKDRHNGNIMIDRSGHIIHIDFGFMFQNYPGGVNFESAPFKLTQEYIDLMDGPESDKFELFKSLIVRGLIEVRNNLDDLLSFITIM